MRFVSLASWALSISVQAAALPSPVPQTGTGAGSCPAEALTPDTWTKLDIDKFLVDWAAANVTNTGSNNVQALAQSFGAPNFFCGLDNFCNAGQPCLPVTLPAWYALLAIQNWNSYMNSVNTAISFASSIISLTLPSLVSDLNVQPKDDVTPMKNLYKMFTSVLGMIPFTGAVATAAGGVTQGIDFIVGQVKPPEPRDNFVAWSDIAGQMGNVVADYQAQVAASFRAIIDAPVDDANAGIFKIVSRGAFLGESRNVTQAEVQKNLIDSFKVYGAALALQAQGFQLSVADNTNPDNGNSCRDSAAHFGVAASCREDGNGAFRQVVLVDKDGFAQSDIMQTLIDKYGVSQDMATQDAVDCINAGTPDPTGDTVPLDPKTPCLFTLPLQQPPPFP